MAQTVIGMFESSSKAQEAVEELVNSGISRDRIDISRNSSGSYSSGSTSSNDNEHESGVTRFFKNLFGSDEDDADKYSRVASNAQSIVTVHAETRDEAEEAADILDDNGAVDVDEHASKLGYNRGGTSSYDTTSSGSGTSGTSGYSGSNLATDTTTGLAGVGGMTGLSGASAGSGLTSGSDYTGTTGTGYTGTAGSTGNSGLAGTGTTGSTSNSDLTGAGYTGSTSSTGSNQTGSTGYTGSDITDDETSRKIPIIEESLEVGKREVRTGGVRVRSRIVERPVEESLRLREEHVNIERNPVDRPATSADLQNFQERDVEMVERAEVPVVNKEARVVEEVSIGKNVEERNETIQDTVRKTEVDVENLDADETRGRTNTNNSGL